MDRKAREILYRQLLEMSENNIAENFEKLISEEEFYDLSDEEVLKYVFWYRDTQTEFPEDQVYVIELPDMNLEGKNLSGVYLSFFQLGIQNRSEKNDSISSVNLGQTGAVINLSTVLYDSVDGIDLFDFSKSNFNGCKLYGVLQGKSKKKIPIMGKENLDQNYLERRDRFLSDDNTENRRIADRLYAKLLTGEDISRIRGINRELELADYEFPFLREGQKNFIYQEIRDRRIDVYNSDLYRKYGIVNSYSLSANYIEYLHDSIIKMIDEYSKNKDEEAISKKIRIMVLNNESSRKYVETAKLLYEESKKEKSADSKRIYLEFVNQLIRKYDLNKANYQNATTSELRNIVKSIFEDAINSAKNDVEYSEVYREFLYKLLTIKDALYVSSIFDLAYSNNEEDLLISKYHISPSSRAILRRDLMKAYEFRRNGELEKSSILIKQILELYKKSSDPKTAENLVNIMFAEKDYETLKVFFNYIANNKAVEIYAQKAYENSDKEEAKIVREIINKGLKRFDNELFVKSVFHRAIKYNDVEIIAENFNSFYYRYLNKNNRTFFIYSVLRGANYNYNLSESEIKDSAKLIDLIMTNPDVNSEIKEAIEKMAVQGGYTNISGKYYQYLKNPDVQADFVRGEFVKYKELDENGRQEFFEEKLQEYLKLFGEVVISEFAYVLRKNQIDGEYIGNDARRLEKMILDYGQTLSSSTTENVARLKIIGLLNSIKDQMNNDDKWKYGFLDEENVARIVSAGMSMDKLDDMLEYKKKEYWNIASREDMSVEDNLKRLEIRNSVKALLQTKLMNKAAQKKVALVLLNMGDSFSIKPYLGLCSDEELLFIANQICEKIQEKAGNVENFVILYDEVAKLLGIDKKGYSFEEKKIIDTAVAKGQTGALCALFDNIKDRETKADVYFYLVSQMYEDADRENQDLREFVQRNYEYSEKYNPLFTRRQAPIRKIVGKGDFEFFRGVSDLEKYPVEQVILTFEDFLAGKDVKLQELTEKLEKDKIKRFQSRTLIQYIKKVYKDNINNLDGEKLEDFTDAVGTILGKYTEIKEIEDLLEDLKLRKRIVQYKDPEEVLKLGFATDEFVKKIVEKEKAEAKYRQDVYSGKMLQKAIYKDYPLDSIIKLIENGSNPNSYDVFTDYDDYDGDGKVFVKFVTPVLIDALEMQDKDKARQVAKALLKAGANPDCTEKRYENSVLKEEKSARDLQDGLVDKLLEEIEVEEHLNPKKEQIYAMQLGMDDETFKRYNKLFYDFTKEKLKNGAMSLSDYDLTELRKRMAIYNAFGVTDIIFEKYVGAVILPPETAYNRIKFLSEKTNVRLGKSNFVGEVLSGHKKFALKYGKILLPDEEVSDSPQYVSKIRKSLESYAVMPENMKKLKENLGKMARKINGRKDVEGR